jgi:hypothetical protein
VTTYCAPARRSFEVLHIAENGADFHAAAGCEPLTACGLVMARDDLWLPIPRRPDDEICRACSGDDQPPRDGCQLALIGGP